MASNEASSFLTSEDLMWLRDNQSQLNLYRANGKAFIKGVLMINNTYQGQLISDKYKIRIDFEERKNSKPVVREMGGRLKALMQARSVSRADLHMYDNGNACLMTPQELNLVYLPNKSLKYLFENYVIPYFYSQSYYEQNDGIWPWPHYPHNLKGILEWYIEHHDLVNSVQETVTTINGLDPKYTASFMLRVKRRESFSPGSKCICGSGRSYTRCASRHIKLTKIAMAYRHG